MAPTKFSEAQTALLENAYKNGLRSTRMDVNEDQIVELSSRTELTVESIKVWINNRKRKDKKQSSLRLELDEDAQAEETDASSTLTLSKAPTHRRPSGWNLFMCIASFKSELRTRPKEDKMKVAHEMYSALGEAEKEKLNVEAKQLKNARLEDLDDGQIDKAISSSMQRISKEKEFGAENAKVALISAKGRKTLRPGAIPTENLPKKSHWKEPPVERRHIEIVKDMILEQPVAYKSFESVKKGLERLTTSWTVCHQDSFVLVQFFDKEYAIPKYVIRINRDFQFDVAVFNWKLPTDCFVYKEFNKSVHYHKVAAVICKIESAKICQGLVDHEAKTSANIQTVPKAIDFESSIPSKFISFFEQNHVLSYKILTVQQCAKAVHL
eukprot:gene10386-11467_t